MNRDSKYLEREPAWQNIVNDLHPVLVFTESYKREDRGLGHP